VARARLAVSAVPTLTVTGTRVAFVARLLYRLRDTDILRTAASLAFTTLLGIVPVFTVAFTYVARYLPFEQSLDALEPFLLRFLLPGSGTVVRQYLAIFMQKAAELTGINTAFVALTALLLVAQVEREFNVIWRVRQGRPLSRRIGIYVLGLTAAPVAIGAAVYLVALLLEKGTGISRLSAIVPTSMRPFEFVIAGLALATVYKVLPARPVRTRHALIGGLVAALGFEAGKFVFKLYMVQVPTYQIVYGTLAVLPLFLIWIYVTWVIVLSGAAIAAALGDDAADAATNTNADSHAMAN
jgi:membrane protein